MTLRETLHELLARESISVDIPRLLCAQAVHLDGLVKSGHIYERSACLRLRSIYKDMSERFKEYELLEIREALRPLYGHQPPPAINMSPPPVRSTNSSGVTGVAWNVQKQLWLAQIFINHRNIYLGSSKFLGAAIKLRLQGELKYGVPNQRKHPITGESEDV